MDLDLGKDLDLDLDLGKDLDLDVDLDLGKDLDLERPGAPEPDIYLRKRFEGIPMEPVLCEICKKVVSPLTCWCVIDTKTHKRVYECKEKCVAPPPPPPPPPPLEPFEITIVNEIEHSNPNDQVTEWSEAYARPSLLQLVRQWFQTPSGYTKVKTS